MWKRKAHQSKGYALLLAVFLVSAMAVSLAVARPNLLTEGRREKELEMIWRGKQYVRGVRLYYKKMHHFPSQLDDLYTPKTGIRFMRQSYKDPMNTADGSWRLIYVGPNGQIIGSLRKQTNAFFFGAPAPTGFAGALGQAPLTSTGGLSGPGSPPAPANNLLSGNPVGLSTAGSVPQNSPSGTGDPAQTTNPSSDPNAANSDSSDSTSASSLISASLQSTPAPLDNSPTMGQTIIIGVGSKINRQSIMKLDGEKNYLQFEFIWNGKDPGSGATLP